VVCASLFLLYPASMESVLGILALVFCFSVPSDLTSLFQFSFFIWDPRLEGGYVALEVRSI